MRCLLFVALLLIASPLHAAERLNIVASFSILGDFVRTVGGDRVSVTTLVGVDSDVHVYTPAPSDAKRIADAKFVVVNGLGLEGWLPRLVQSSGSKATIVTASAYDVTDMNQPISRLRSAHNVGEAWTVEDATELYEIARWGKGYFTVGGNGQVKRMDAHLQAGVLGKQRLARRRQVFRAARGELEPAALGRQQPRDAEADAAGAARDQRPAAVDVQVHAKAGAVPSEGRRRVARSSLRAPDWTAGSA